MRRERLSRRHGEPEIGRRSPHRDHVWHATLRVVATALWPMRHVVPARRLRSSSDAPFLLLIRFLRPLRYLQAESSR